VSTTNHLSAYMTRLWRTVAVVALAAIGIWMVSLVVTGLLILFAGILLAIFLSHLSQRIQRFSGHPYGASLCLVVLSILAILAATGYFMGSRISEQVSEFSEMFSTASELTWERLENLGLRSWVGGGATCHRASITSHL
jgi:predicted PurR-regulated permease PerM